MGSSRGACWLHNGARHTECAYYLFKLPLARLVGSRKIGGDGERRLTGGGPFAAADEGSDEADAGLGIVAVAHGGVEDAAFAVVEGDDHRLVAAGSLLGWIGKCRERMCMLWAGPRS